MSHRACVSLFLVLLSGALFAAPEAGKTDLDFGLWLMERKEYFRAVSEFQRFAFFQPRSPRVAEAQWLSGLALFRAGRYGEAVEAFGRVGAETEFGYRTAVYTADSFFQLGSYEKSRKAYLELKEKYPDRTAELTWRMSWPSLMDRKFDEALADYDALLASGYAAGEADYLRNQALKLKSFRPYSPAVAGLLSALLPGAGQVYARRPGDGLVAFATCGLLTAGAWLAWQYDPHKELAVALSIADLFFYAGNIYSAVTSVRKYNVLYYRKNLAGLKDNYWKEYPAQ